MFPGQGAQFVGMGRDLLEADVETQGFLERAESTLGVPLRRLMLQGPAADLQATQNAQPAIVFHSLALLTHLSRRGVVPAAVAGHSLGEFPALVAARGLTPLDALRAVRSRGEAMAAAAPGSSGMTAVLGLDDPAVDRVCEGIDGVVVANYNAPGQVVISGRDRALDMAEAALRTAGARRLVRLPVSAAFHSPMMASAASRFAQDWNRIALKPLELVQVFNADASVHRDPNEVRALMVGQLTGPVRWTQSIRRLGELGVDTFVEIGPGRTLTGLVKKILPSAVLHNIEDMSGLDAFLEGVHA